MSFELTAPDTITVGTPIAFSFTSLTRVSGRIRLTSGTDAIAFRLATSPDEISAPSAGHRVRGKAGEYQIIDWGEHESGVELVLRFEGKKAWMKVT